MSVFGNKTINRAYVQVALGFAERECGLFLLVCLLETLPWSDG